MPPPDDDDMEEDVQDEESDDDQPPKLDLQVPLEFAQRLALEKEEEAKKLVQKPGRNLAVKKQQKPPSIHQLTLITEFEQYGNI